MLRHILMSSGASVSSGDYWIAVQNFGNADVGQGIAADSSGNCYVTGYTNNGSNDDVFIAKYNTSGTLQWQRKLYGASTDYGYGVAVDSSGNCYVTGSTNNG